MMRRRVSYSKPAEKDIRDQLKDWGLLGPGADKVVSAWLKFRNHNILPFAGGWFDQPQWVEHDFSILDALEIYHQIQHDKPSTPTAKFFDIFKRGK